MSGSIGSSTAQVSPAYHHHHAHHSKTASGTDNDDPFADASSSTAGTSGASSSATAASTSDTSTAGIQKFAAELQSILLSAQSGQPTAAGTTAQSATAASDPADATDPTLAVNAPPSSGPGAGASGIRHLADRLQELLSSNNLPAGSATPAASSTPSTAASSTAIASSAGSDPNSLQSVLDRLQTTLQQTLANYGSSAQIATSGTLVTS